ncbi:hypothetical protein Bca52824_069184 [Brassica carinata]|uniref:Uncharacterized protein n=1 Tax=Brassica carinata TaxID=52824 RepID=A0A8X7Q414_BRACI|nr:hypothetical protein Bca52824_069184 [Brassica carinata]
MVISQAEESDFRALQEAPYASWRGSSAWRRFGDSSTDSSAVFGLSVVLGEGRAVAVLCSLMGVQVRQIPTTLDLRALEIRLLEGVCSSCCRRVSEHVVVFREVLLRSGVGGVVYGDSKAML